MKLTDQQLRFYETFGFLKFPGLFAIEAKHIEDEFEKVWAETDMEDDHKSRSYIEPFVDRSEYLSRLLEHPRINAIVSSILGYDYNYTSSDGNYFDGSTNWHSDQFPKEPYQSLKIAFYLDFVTRDTGCLRVIPGSCHRGDRFTESLNEVVPLSRQNHNEEVWGVHGSEVPAYAVDSEPGDMLLFNHKTKHSSWGGSRARRMLAINFEQRFSDDLMPWLKDLTKKRMNLGYDRAYGEVLLDVASPKYKVHLEQRIAVWNEVTNESGHPTIGSS